MVRVTWRSPHHCQRSGGLVERVSLFYSLALPPALSHHSPLLLTRTQDEGEGWSSDSSNADTDQSESSSSDEAMETQNGELT